MSKINDKDIKKRLNQAKNLATDIKKLVQIYADDGSDPAIIIHGLVSGLASVTYTLSKISDFTPEKLLEIVIEGYDLCIREIKNHFSDYKDISKDMQ